MYSPHRHILSRFNEAGGPGHDPVPQAPQIICKLSVYLLNVNCLFTGCSIDFIPLPLCQVTIIHFSAASCIAWSRLAYWAFLISRFLNRSAPGGFEAIFLVHPANEYLQYFHATLYNGPGGVVPAEAGIQSKCRSCCTDLSTQDYPPLLISSSRPAPTS